MSLSLGIRERGAQKQERESSVDFVAAGVWYIAWDGQSDQIWSFPQAENSACRAFIKRHRPEAVLPFLADIEHFQKGRQAWVAKASFGGVSGKLNFEPRKRLTHQLPTPEPHT